MEQLCKQVYAEKNTRNNKRAMFSVRSVPRDYGNDKEDIVSQLSFEMPTCQDMSLELNWGTGASELLSAVQFSWQSGYEEKTLHVL
jgi:hypothetical protein